MAATPVGKDLQKRLEHSLAVRAVTTRRRVERTMREHHHPRCLLPINFLKIVLQPVQLRIHPCKRTGELGTSLIGAGQAVAEIRLGVYGDKVRHAVVVGVPEVLETAAGAGGHAPVVAVACEVCLAHHANCFCVDLYYDVSVAWSYPKREWRARSSDRWHVLGLWLGGSSECFSGVGRASS